MGRKLKIHKEDLRKLRRQMKWTGSGVAAKANSLGLNITKETIVGIEKGNLPMTNKQMATLTEIYDSSL